ncbi:MAG: beta-ketoacyl-ACP synthase [Succinivibrionaceae bacterium]
MVYLNNFACISPLGNNDAMALGMLSSQESPYMDYLGGYLPHDQRAFLGFLPFDLPQSDCRNNQMIRYCLDNLEKELQEVFTKFDKKRIGVVVGTSTSAITDVESSIIQHYHDGDAKLFYDNRICEIGNVSEYIKNLYSIEGPCYTVATACSSSAKAIVSGSQLIEAGVCDAVIVGGSDSLSRVTVSGFFALSALSIDHCLPFHKDRCGINISEGCGLTILTKEPINSCKSKAIKLLGYGMTTDGYHISAPEPFGKQGIVAVRQALEMAKLEPKDVGYVNMHGTGTKLNDSMEYYIIKEVFGKTVPVSSTKHITGHTLGAAGIVEAYISWLLLNNDISLPYHDYEEKDLDPTMTDINILISPCVKLQKKVIMSNNFAFGGNNISLIFGKEYE